MLVSRATERYGRSRNEVGMGTAFLSESGLSQLRPEHHRPPQVKRRVKSSRHSRVIPCALGPELLRQEAVSSRAYDPELLKRGAQLASASPAEALRRGRWCKLICGASFEDLPFVANLAEVYTLAGVDCIDCAAEPAVVSSVIAGVDKANWYLRQNRLPPRRPYVMVSINDDEDPHFRKASFDPQKCPQDCPRPCERICPTKAISAKGVAGSLCYGCGRCPATCPLGLITTHSYQRNPAEVVRLLQDYPVDAVEVHTRGDHADQFHSLWQTIRRWVLARLKLVAVSFPNSDRLPTNLQEMHRTVSACVDSSAIDIIWQTDGRPMSGDIGRGATYPAISLAGKVLHILETNNLSGFVQLAGGTNGSTLDLMSKNPHVYNHISGIAFGGYARKLVDAPNMSADGQLLAALGLLAPLKLKARLV